MGQVIHLADRRARRAGGASPARASAFYFELSCPFSYLAGEQVERLLGGAEWRPAPRRRRDAHPVERLIVSRAERSEAERAAEVLRLPLSWPENYGADCTPLHRAAAFAHEHGVGAAFALAALRLGFSGGFDLADPQTLVEAAAAARLPVAACVEAAADHRYDLALSQTRRELASAGVHRRPAIRVGARWCEGPSAVIEAAALRAEPTGFDTRPAG